MLRKISSLARLVFIDGLRRHALMGLVLLAFGLEAGGLLFFEFIPKDIGRASADFILSVGWLTGLLFLLFHAVQVMAWDEERRIIHTLLARPISRTQYVLGTFLGLVVLLLLLNILLGVLGFGVLLAVKDSVKTVYFTHLSLPHYLLSWCGLLCVELMILSIIMLFSGLVRGGFPVLLLTISYYFICTGLPVVREAFVSRSLETGSTVPTLLQWLTAIFPDFSRYDVKMLVTSQQSVDLLQHVVVDLGMMVLYVSIVLWLAAMVYQRRDLQ